MLWPSHVTEGTAVCWKGKILPAGQVPSCVSEPESPFIRVFLRGGGFYEVPEHALVPTVGRPIYARDLRTGLQLPASGKSLAFPRQSLIPYDYEAPDTHGKPVRHSGTFTMTADACELLGWLVGAGSFQSTDQSIRFSNSDAWSLARIEELATREFPSVKCTMFAKNRGDYDLTITKVGKGALREFIRRCDFYGRFPLVVNHLDYQHRIAFARGFWGSDGWVSILKGGNDVDLGMSSTRDHSFTSLNRLFHAMTFGMNGSVRYTNLSKDKDLHRLVFSGYANYRKFHAEVGRIRSSPLKAPPPVKRVQPPLLCFSDPATQQQWSYSSIQRILPVTTHAKIVRLAKEITCE